MVVKNRRVIKYRLFYLRFNPKKDRIALYTKYHEARYIQYICLRVECHDSGNTTSEEIRFFGDVYFLGR